MEFPLLGTNPRVDLQPVPRPGLCRSRLPGIDGVRLGTLPWIPRFLAMQSRASEYPANAALCAMHALAVPDPMKPFYLALELQWECLARLAEREAEDQAAAASQTSKAA